MYEPFFGLRKRPYAAAADAEILVETPAVAEAVDRLDRCVRQGRGIGVLTAAAGMGKTHLLHRLARQWGEEFRPVVLPNAAFPTRRGLLQSVLAELGQPYQRLAETELRLELTAVARAAREECGGVVLLFDEAHRHSERMLEEIRLIANVVDKGEPLVRVVLAGQVELEEKLSEPAYAEVNERVGELVSLPRFTAEESRRYLAERAAFAGGDLEGLFDEAAVRVLVQACGGVPRCLNQLADHSLLLGYVAERRPVDEGLVREALDDLKRLPLHWCDPLPTIEVRNPDAGRPEGAFPAASPSFDEVIEVGGMDGGVEVGADMDVPSGRTGDVTAVTESAEWGQPAAEPQRRSRFGGGVTGNDFKAELSVAPPAANETILDRFARLDAADACCRWLEMLDREESARPVAAGPQREPVRRPAANPLEILDRIEPLIAEALASGENMPTSMPSSVERRFEREAGGRIAGEAAAVASAVAVDEPAAVGRADVRRSTLFSDLRRRKSGGA